MIEAFARHKVAANLTMVVMILAEIWALYTIPTQRSAGAVFGHWFMGIN